MPPMSGLPAGPSCPVVASPAYSLARNDLQDDGSVKMLLLVMVLFGSTVSSPHPAEARSRTPSVRSRVVAVVRMMLSGSEAERNATQIGARARIDGVVDAVDARRRIDAAVLRGREDVLDGREEPRTLGAPQPLEGVAEGQVVHPQERRLLDVDVGEVERAREAVLEHARVQAARRRAARDVA